MHSDMMKRFSYDHLSGDARTVSAMFAEMAELVDSTLDDGREKSVAMRKLLESKDAAVRAVTQPGG